MSPLRPSQIRLLESLKSKQNKIVVARTGFGKTRVAQEHIQMLLHEDRKARTIFLNNQAILARQQSSKSFALLLHLQMHSAPSGQVPCASTVYITVHHCQGRQRC